MRTSTFLELAQKLVDLGYGHEIEWQQNVKPCDNSIDFREETIWVILNSGMKEQIARQIKNRIDQARRDGVDISTVFRHKGKVAAIKYVIEKCAELFEGWLWATDPIAFLQTVPYIGKITCWHLAKNLGGDYVKPDRHLVRIALQYGVGCDALCSTLATATGYRKATIDIILWRAANLKLI